MLNVKVAPRYGRPFKVCIAHVKSKTFMADFKNLLNKTLNCNKKKYALPSIVNSILNK